MSDLKVTISRSDKLKASEDNKQTLGWLYVQVGGKMIFECATLELAWRDNKRNISSIPEGIYTVIKVGPSPNIDYNHFLFLNVSNRGGVCIHVANYARELRGCVAVGEKHIDIDNDGLRDVTNSRKTLEQLLDILPDKFELAII